MGEDVKTAIQIVINSRLTIYVKFHTRNPCCTSNFLGLRVGLKTYLVKNIKFILIN